MYVNDDDGVFFFVFCFLLCLSVVLMLWLIGVCTRVHKRVYVFVFSRFCRLVLGSLSSGLTVEHFSCYIASLLLLCLSKRSF